MFEGIAYSQAEINFYNYLFDSNKQPQSGYIEGKEVAQLFMKANLQRDTLKVIWDSSSKRKAQNLSREEFYYACRCVALGQIGKELNDFNVKQLNNSTLLPVFNGIQFHQPVITGIKAQDDVKLKMSMGKSGVINRNMMKAPVLTPNAVDDDDFITIDEDADKQIKPKESIKQVELNIVNSLLKDFDLNRQKQKEKEKEEQKQISKPQPIIEEAKPKKNIDELFIYLENYDQKKNKKEEFVAIDEDKKEPSHNEPDSTINESIVNLPIEAKDLPIDLTAVLKPNHDECNDNLKNLHKDIMNQTEIAPVNSSSKKESAFNSKTPVIQTTKPMNIDDLMQTLDFDFKKDKAQTESMTPEIHHNKTVEVSKNPIEAKDNEFDDDDFCEVEEDNQAHDNMSSLKKDDDKAIGSGSNINSIPIDSIITDTLKPTEEEIKDKSQLEPKEEQVIETKVEAEKEEENKPSILNFTQMDFLQEFKKEINPNQSNEVEDKKDKEDQFEFIEVDESHKPPITRADAPKQFNPIDCLFIKNFKSEEHKAKFNSNLSLIFQAISKEYSAIAPLLKELLTLSDLTCSDESLFTSKQLTNFLNGTIRLLLLHNKFLGTKEFIKNNKLETNKKQQEEIVSLIRALSQVKRFESMIDINKVNELNNIPKINCDDVKEGEDVKDCLLCLHSSANERITNLFGHDFHIKCINVWLNRVEPKSPFIQ